MSNFVTMSGSISIIRCKSAVPGLYLDSWEDKGGRFPPADIYIKDDEVHIYADIPGVEENDLSLYVFEHFVVIEGVKNYNKHNNQHKYLCLERRFSEFRRIFKLPFDPVRYNTDLTDGVLHIALYATA